ncbi:MAG: hypothetical protein CSB48_10115 [Proteobacteria bacterium]|nr:MAG: hypothetical protein CSB48_10115 [Pseudomonadota bacterium]
MADPEIESKLQINNLSQLKAHLTNHKIDYSKWKLKNVSDLLKEIEQGDCQLWISHGEHQQESKLTRKVKVGYCHISCKGKWIKELRQQ